MIRTIIPAVVLMFLTDVFIYALPEGQNQPSTSSYQISGSIGYAIYDSKNVQAHYRFRTECTASVPCAEYDKLFPHKPYYQFEALYRWKTSAGVGLKIFYNDASERIEGLKGFSPNYLPYKANQSISCIQLGLFFDSYLIDLMPDYKCNFIVGFGYQRFSTEFNEQYPSSQTAFNPVHEEYIYNTGYIEPGLRLTYKWNSISLGINLSYSYCLDDYVSMSWNGVRLGAIAGVSI